MTYIGYYELIRFIILGIAEKIDKCRTFLTTQALENIVKTVYND